MISSIKEFYAFIREDQTKFFIAFAMVILNSASGVITPFVVAYAVDTYIIKGDLRGLGIILIALGGLYIVTVIVGYLQSRLIGQVSQRTLFRLRTALFDKLQELPIAYFNQNKAGDLMSRLNNDTDKLNQFLSESIPRFVGNFFVIFGIAVFIVVLNWKLGLVALSSVFFLIIITKVLSPWVEGKNKKSLAAIGEFSASLQENLTNFRVIVAFSKRDYFAKHVGEINKTTFKTTFISDVAGRVFEPIYDMAGSAALIAVLAYGMYLVGTGAITIGILVAYVSYTQKFYDPLRIMATIFGSIQLAMAAWSRLRVVLNTENTIIKVENNETSSYELEVKDVSFGYGERKVLEQVSLTFEKGKTYALVGPTGGGKSTLVSLMSRLYDPHSGTVFIDGKDIRSFDSPDRASVISVILQDPFIFSGSIFDNIRYGNDALKNVSDADLEKFLKEKGFEEVLGRLKNTDNLSLGQKQLISFMRVILREPKILILDEATANIDTVTETILNKTLASLPADTTKVIIAHRLNTIKEADEIYFVNGRHVTRAGNLNEAVSLIEHAKRTS
jgi:ATP-binding cassette subfamily B protein